MVEKSIINVVNKYLNSLNNMGIPVSFGVIYGSQLNQKANQWSDIDLLVVSKKFDLQKDPNDINLLWRIAARVDSRIEPIPVGLRQYSEDDSSAIVEIARRQGYKVPLAE
jgi:predicted nucleotidyltransferase